jgi:hypothetical protein
VEVVPVAEQPVVFAQSVVHVDVGAVWQTTSHDEAVVCSVSHWSSVLSAGASSSPPRLVSA